MTELPRRALFAALALPALLRAALRLGRLSRSLDLEDLAERMADVPAWRLTFLSNPRYLDACVQRFSGFLPPGRMGPCLKRSFLLLDLWSRCGLRPRIHVGAKRPAGSGPGFHAWTSVPGVEDPPPGARGHVEIWSHPSG